MSPFWSLPTGFARRPGTQQEAGQSPPLTLVLPRLETDNECRQLGGGDMCILIAIGWIISAVIWAEFGWVWGLIAFVLFGLSGFGWVLIAGGVGALWTLTSPTRHQFRKAWKQLGCDSEFGADMFEDYFIEWASIYKPEGMKALLYLRREVDKRRARISATAERFLSDDEYALDVWKGEVIRALEEDGGSPDLVEKVRAELYSEHDEEDEEDEEEYVEDEEADEEEYLEDEEEDKDEFVEGEVEYNVHVGDGEVPEPPDEEVGTRLCPQCGAHVRDGGKFCGECGSALRRPKFCRTAAQS